MKITDLPAKQVKRYLKELQSFEPHKQLLIKVGGGLLEDEAAIVDLAEALSELTSNGVHLLLVHGGGPQLTAALNNNGHDSRFVDGNRYTDEATLKLAKTVFAKLSEELVKVLSGSGINAMTLPAERLFTATREAELGWCAREVTTIAAPKIADALKKHDVLVLNSLACEQDTNHTLNVNADIVFQALACELQPHRMTSLTPTGGVLKPNGSAAPELISGLDVRDIEGLIADGTVSGGMALKLRELARILNNLPVGSAISITKPSELLAELLTDQGSGTFVGKGEKIITTADIADISEELASLIKTVFGKSLPDNYEQQAFEQIYFTSDRRAFGIVTKLSDGTPYLDKLAVSPRLQGRGVGESLWYKIIGDFPAILWRSHVTNRYATWYHRHADIMKRHGEWVLFGKGIDFAELESREQELIDIPAMR